MRNHHYTITVENEAPNKTGPPQGLRFGAEPQDEIPGLVERSRQRGEFDTDTAAAFTVGLKLLGEVMLKNRSHPLFEEFGPQFGEFMKRLKGGKGQNDRS